MPNIETPRLTLIKAPHDAKPVLQITLLLDAEARYCSWYLETALGDLEAARSAADKLGRAHPVVEPPPVRVAGDKENP